MKAEFVNIRAYPFSDKGTAIITIKYTPNWFESLLGKTEYSAKCVGSVLTWYQDDFFRVDTETEWWLHTIWAKWMTENGD